MYRYIISVLFLLSLLIYGCGRKTPSYREGVFDLTEKENETEHVAGENVSDTEAEDVSEEDTVCYVYVCGKSAAKPS